MDAKSSVTSINNSVLGDGSYRLSQCMNPHHHNGLPQHGVGDTMTQKDIQELVTDVKQFSLTLTELRDLLSGAPDVVTEDLKVLAHEKLAVVLCTIQEALRHYPRLQTVELLTAAAKLIPKVKNCCYDKAVDIQVLLSHIDYLAEVFGKSVTELLVGEGEHFNTLTKTKSYDTLLNEDGLTLETRKSPANNLTHDVEPILMMLEDGVSIALSRTKSWSKYVKDLINYIEKKTALDMEYSKSLVKLSNNAIHALGNDSFLPLRSIYTQALEQELLNASGYHSTSAGLQSHYYIEPLSNQRAEHDKKRKQLKEKWSKETKRMQETHSACYKARHLYMLRQQEYKLFEQSTQHEEAVESVTGVERGGSSFQGSALASSMTYNAKIEKKKKQEYDTQQKAMDAEIVYKKCVKEANYRVSEMLKVKCDILEDIRDLIYQGDHVLKSVSMEYFKHQAAMTQQIPLHYESLGKEVLSHEPGIEYKAYVHSIQTDKPTVTHEHYVFEPFSYQSHRQTKRRNSLQSRESDFLSFFSESPNASSRFNESSSSSINHSLAWYHAHHVNNSSANSDNETSYRSDEAPPPFSRFTLPLANSSSLGDLTETGLGLLSNGREGVKATDSLHSYYYQGMHLSSPGRTHVFRRLTAPAGCKQCDNHIISLQGVECTQCGITCHRQCLEILRFECDNASSLLSESNSGGISLLGGDKGRRMTTFGVDFALHIQETHTAIPPLITKCIEEINRRGLDFKGIYRVSGVKSRVEMLCQSFELDQGHVDLSDHHPNVIANVLKLYLRKLPEPLLTFFLYHPFIELAKLDMSGDINTGSAAGSVIIEGLLSLIRSLPIHNQKALCVLIAHLRLVSDNSAVNHMNATNLGIVFGPTLLRPRETSASLNSLLDTPYQTRVIELLISNNEHLATIHASTAMDLKTINDNVDGTSSTTVADIFHATNG